MKKKKVIVPVLITGLIVCTAFAAVSCKQTKKAPLPKAEKETVEEAREIPKDDDLDGGEIENNDNEEAVGIEDTGKDEEDQNDPANKKPQNKKTKKDPENSITSKLAGRWKCYGFVDADGNYLEKASSETITFDKKKNYVYEMKNSDDGAETQEGKWSVKDGEIILDNDLKFELSDDNILLSETEMRNGKGFKMYRGYKKAK